MCELKKKIWLWTVVNRKTKKLVDFFSGERSSESLEKLCENISHIEAKFYATDKFPAYDIIPPDKNLLEKSHTFTVERMNRLISYYLVSFVLKTYCWSKNLNIVENSFLLFLHRTFISSIYF